MEQLIQKAANELRKPAGDAEIFSSGESILRHRSEFVLRCHATWKKGQKAIHQLLFHEGFLRRNKSYPLGPGIKEFGEYNRAVWRRVNDAIVWTVLGTQRHRVKRLCLYRKRGDLSESNPTSALSAIAAINEQPMSLALWNDATSCVDIGDLTVIENGLEPVPQFIELKQGTVNEAIGALLVTEGEARDTAIQVFEERYGKKGIKQFQRVLRQKQIGDQALELLVKERGIDPLSGYAISVVETIEPQIYDEIQAAIMEAALTERKEMIECVDGCLWIYANGDKRLQGPQSAKRFAELLSNRIPELVVTRAVRHPQRDRDKIYDLSGSVHHPMARPLFIRKLTPQHIASVMYGALNRNVFIYLDWEAFGRLIQKAGGEFRWGSEKDTGRANAVNRHIRPPLVRGRLPQIHVDGAIGHISDPNLIEMFYDGMTPWSMAQITVQQLHRVVSERAHPGQQ